MTGNHTGRPTLEQVAALAGVGRGTVSRVVNGEAHVSPQAKEAVERAIVELGYVPNRAARSLVTRRTDSIALVVSESGERFFAEPFFGRIVQGVSAALAGTRFQLLLTIAQSAEERGRLDHYLTRQHVDGALLLSLHGDDPLPVQLESRGVPTVRAGRPTRERSDHWVDADNLGGARLAAEHLAGRGRRRLATIGGPQDMAVGVARLDGFQEVAGGDLVEYGDFSEDSGAAAMRRLLDRAPDLDAVFAASDPMAAGALRVLKESGRRVPEDVAVVGFDDSAIARHTDPALTSVHQPVEAMGREMVALLVDRIDGAGDGPRELTLPTRLTVRASS
ncbi:LacI family DNA-binding transcriptional regulator [Longispora sp. NPDC051575]|uniref:LacI family DNA-binding transcriptional regulator n=1 Tax=Longispora sp. NPDC051575 TaxID=3154943 RepID=UPI0034399CBA